MDSGYHLLWAGIGRHLGNGFDSNCPVSGRAVASKSALHRAPAMLALRPLSATFAELARDPTCRCHNYRHQRYGSGRRDPLMDRRAFIGGLALGTLALPCVTLPSPHARSPGSGSSV
jgi:hypothetical protein